MDSPDKSRRYQSSDVPFLIALTDEERLHGLDLFGDEPSRGELQPSAAAHEYERVPAYADTVDPQSVSRAEPPAVPERRRTAPTPLESWNSPLWYAPALAAVLTVVTVVYAVLTVRVMRATPDTTIATLNERSAKPSQTARIVPSPPRVVATPPPVAAAAISADETARRADEPTARVSAGPQVERAAAVTERAVVVKPETAEVRDSLVQAVSDSDPRTADALQAAIPPFAGSPTLPASPRVEPRALDVVSAVRPRAETTAVAMALPPAPEAAIQAALGQYRTAYRELDAGAARAVWPSVDAKALRKAFDSLEQQDLVFDSCQIAVTNNRAVASCRGFAWYVPRVGNKNPHDDQREWEFTLRRSGEAWLIDTVSAR